MEESLNIAGELCITQIEILKYWSYNLSNINNNLTPKEIVSFLDRYVIGQRDAKKTIAVALRNRYRRMQLSPELQQDVMPKNILMIGNTGVGKTEIARRLSKMMRLPFIKVEASKYTEVGICPEEMLRVG